MAEGVSKARGHTVQEEGDLGGGINEARKQHQNMKDIDAVSLNSDASHENVCYIIIFDSMSKYHYQAISRIKNFLTLEAHRRYNLKVDPNTIRSLHAKTPQQTNHSDCGVYMLKYFDMFLSNPIKYLNIVKENVRKDEEWFTTEEAGLMRSFMMSRMRELSDEHKAREREDYNCDI